MNFNTEQQEAILHEKGPAMVIAGPGSGKTAVIVNRVDHLIRLSHIPPQNILVITFTRAAAAEMKTRYLGLSREAETAVSFGTFHSVFFYILRVSMGLKNSSVVTGKERYGWFRELLAKEPEADIREQEFIGELTGEILNLKGSGKDPTAYKPRCCGPELFLKAYRDYEERLKVSDKLDFEDMLLRCRRLLAENPTVREFWQKRWKYILVDEFQDINSLQYETVRLLAEPCRNLFIVGDDDQSIYRFRGAEPSIMLRFPQNYPEAKVISLRDCYRMSPELLAASGRLIACNKNRYPKALRSGRPKGTGPVLYAFEDPKAQKKALFDALKRQHREGLPWREMAVLCRTNFGAAGYAAGLLREGIPFQTRETLPELYAQPVAEDVFAYMALGAGSRERRHFLRIANRPLRYLPRAAFRTERVDYAELRAYFTGKPRMQECVDRLFYDLQRLAKLMPYAAVEYLRKEMGYDAFLKDKADARGTDPESELEILDRLQEESAEFPDFAAWQEHREDALRAAAEKPERREETEDALLLTTLHGAKGLEFTRVFLPDVNEGNIPHKKAENEEDLEEERRLFYVAVTRASRGLWLSFVKRSRAGRVKPSRFLKELLPE